VIDGAKSFDRAAEEYERTRPDYPDGLLELVPVAPDATVVDVGAGTGKLTRVLARRYAHVIAVEPLDGMRAILERVVPGVEAHGAGAETLPLADASVDALFAGQAFHWFANPQAIDEFARVLRPGGVLCLIWNEGDDTRPDPRPPAFVELLETLHADARAAFADRPPWQDVIALGPFGEVHEARRAHDHVLDRQGLLDNVRSMSWIARRDPEEQAEIVQRLGALLPDATYAMPNRANAMWAVRA
jgi:SAM-dependent methyltransferase